jgi:hypothetical protein
MPDINDLRASLSAANTAMAKLQVAKSILDLRTAPKPAPAKRITKKAANEAWDSLSFAVDSLSGAFDTELLRQDAPGYLGPRMQVLRDMVAAGWPVGTVTPDGLLERAQAVIDRWTRLKSEGMTKDMGRGEAWTYLVNDKGVPKDKVDAILEFPTGTTMSGQTPQPRYTMEYLNAKADQAFDDKVARDELIYGFEERMMKLIRNDDDDGAAALIIEANAAGRDVLVKTLNALFMHHLPMYGRLFDGGDDRGIGRVMPLEKAVDLVTSGKFAKGNSADPLVDAGFKKVNDYTWSKSVETEPGTVKLFNVRYAGTPRLYRLTASVSFPGKGITGAATRDIGQYQTAEEAVSAYESESSAVAPAQKDPKMTRQEAIRYISQADYLPFPMVEQARAGFPEIAADVDYLNEVDDRVVKADSAKIEAIAARYEGERDMMGLISRAREAVLPDVGPFDPDLGDPFGGSGSRTWLVTNARGYRKQHKSDTMVGAIQLGMNDVDYTLESSEWTAVEAEGDTVPSLVPPPVETPAEDVERSADATFLQSMITGAINLLDENLITKLEPMFEKYASDDAMMDMLGKAAEAYSAAATEAAKAAMK